MAGLGRGCRHALCPFGSGRRKIDIPAEKGYTPSRCGAGLRSKFYVCRKFLAGSPALALRCCKMRIDSAAAVADRLEGGEFVSDGPQGWGGGSRKRLANGLSKLFYTIAVAYAEAGARPYL